MSGTVVLPKCEKCKKESTVLTYSNEGHLCGGCWTKLVNSANLFTATKKHDPVNHPSHYCSHPSGIECIEVTRHMNFNLGNAVKYIWRAGDKGKLIEDLQKAIFYLNDEIKRLEKNGQSA